MRIAKFAGLALSAALVMVVADRLSAAPPKSGGSIPVVSSVSTATKKMVNGTTNLFTPKKAAPVKRSGTTAIYAPQQQPKQAKPGLLDRWFGTAPPPPPKTINEWMKLEQIHPSGGKR